MSIGSEFVNEEAELLSLDKKLYAAVLNKDTYVFALIARSGVMNVLENILHRILTNIVLVINSLRDTKKYSDTLSFLNEDSTSLKVLDEMMNALLYKFKDVSKNFSYSLAHLLNSNAHFLHFNSHLSMLLMKFSSILYDSAISAYGIGEQTPPMIGPIGNDHFIDALLMLFEIFFDI
mgnify:FL=1